VVALSVATVLLASALSVDMGMLWQTRRKLQTVADAAAISGAQAEINGDSSTPAAQNSAQLNGFASSSLNTLTINDPPQSGSYAGQSGYVEVVASQKVPTYFLRMLGLATVDVSARAVAAYAPPTQNGCTGSNCNPQVSNGRQCIYALNPSADQAILFDGASLFECGCGVVVNSQSTTAVVFDDVNISTAPGFTMGIVGDYQVSPLLGLNFLTYVKPKPVTHTAPVVDPLATLAAPSFDSSNCDYTNLNANGVVTLSNGLPVVGSTLNPGVYCGGITATGTAVLKFNPGTYIMLGGGINLQQGAVMQGSGVMFYLTGNSTYPYGGLNINIANANSLSAPTSGTYAGILFFQDRTIDSTTAGNHPNTVVGANLSKYEGVLYFSSTTLAYAGASGAKYTIIIADKIDFTGASVTVISTDFSLLPLGAPIKSVAQVE
jgi:hypothetical protein